MKNRRIYKIIFLALLGIYFTFFRLNPVNAQTISLQENFNDGNANDGSPADWEEYSPSGEWYVENGEYVGMATNFDPVQASYSVAGNKNWQDYSFNVRVMGTEGVDKTILFRFNEGGNTYVLNMRSSFFGDGNDIVLAKKMPIGSTNVHILEDVSYSNFGDTWYEIQVDVVNNAEGVLIKVFVGGSPVLEYLDLDEDQPIYNGAIGFEVWPGGYSRPLDNLTTTNRFDDVLVTTIGDSPPPTPQPSLNVPDFKQYDSPWGNELYDHADVWSSTEATIERWGCGLTSATMVLQYHGFPINPDGLNDWLNDEPDGYIRNGLLNWLAVSRYTYKNTTGDSPTLEFRRYDASSTTLEEELNAERPPILGLSGHFVVAKGKQNSDFSVNDPDSTIDSLSEVEIARETKYSSIYSYLPSNTDLSYIMLVVDSNITLTVYDSEDNEVGNFYPDEFLKDDVSGEKNEPLNIFLLPTPEDGVYRVEATGPAGSYQLDSYLYNEQGEVQTFSSERTIAGEDQKDEFLITIDGVIDTPDTTSPVVGITSPVNNTILKGLVDIVGSVSDDVKLSHYNFSLYPGTTDLSDGNTHSGERLNDSNWCTIPISGTVSLTDDFSGNLCTDWDTTQYVDGEYQIRLAARDAAGNRDTSDPDTGGTSSVHIIGITIDNTAPVVEITSHDDGDLVSGVVEVRGSVSDNNPHHYYAVLRDSSNSVVVGAGVVNRYDSFTDEVLFTFDSTILNEGETYTIWLAARDAAENRDNNAGSLDIVKIVINNTPDIQISISSIINDLEILQGKINSRLSRLYRLLHTQLKVANKLFDRGLTRPTKALLRAVYRKIKAFAPRFIDDPEASQILQDNLLILLGTL